MLERRDTVRPGDQVILNVPHNPRLNGAQATVSVVTEWGAHVSTRAAATGGYRAGWDELVLLAAGNGKHAAEAVPTGDVCTNCGGDNMHRAGACLTCWDCGTSGGCG